MNRLEHVAWITRGHVEGLGGNVQGVVVPVQVVGSATRAELVITAAETGSGYDISACADRDASGDHDHAVDDAPFSCSVADEHVRIAVDAALAWLAKHPVKARVAS